MKESDFPAGWTPVPDPTKLTTEAVNTLERRLRELYDLRFEQLDLRLEQRFQAQQKAIDSALIAADLKTGALSDKIDRLNAQFSSELPKLITREEYKTITDRIESLLVDNKTLVSRTEYSVQHEVLVEKIDDLRTQANLHIGRLSVLPSQDQQINELARIMMELKTQFAVSQGTAAGSNLEKQMEQIKQKIDSNSTSIITAGGKSTGIQQSWGYLVGGFGLLSVIITIIFAVTK